MPRDASLKSFKRIARLVFRTDSGRLDRQIRRGRVVVGDGTYGSPLVVDYTGRYSPGVAIGNYCSIAEGVTILVDGQHRTDWTTTFPIRSHLFGDRSWEDGSPLVSGPVRIGHDVWIGYRATILGGCQIGNGAVIAAGAVVAVDVRDYSIVGGVPAREIRRRFSDEICDALNEISWWNLRPDQVRQLSALLSDSPHPRDLAEAVKRQQESSGPAER
jgi:acetyltransferase-like isoleucine patch superfamily enzyme